MWNENEKKPIMKYLVLTFLIAWSSEALIILGERTGILTGSIGKVIVYLIIGLGAGCAPAYAVLILLKNNRQITSIKDFFKRIFHTDNVKKTVWITLAFYAVLIVVDMIFSKYIGYPWYYMLLIPVVIAVMIFGGGIEEIGWRGFLQPSMETKMPFVAAALLVGVIWSVWHLPLWFVQSSSQSSYNFWAFMLSCISRGFLLAALYKLTKCTFACVLLHAWTNVLDGIYMMNSLSGIPNIKTTSIWIAEIIAAIVLCTVVDKRQHKQNEQKLIASKV